MANTPKTKQELIAWLWVVLWSVGIFVSIPLARAIQSRVETTAGDTAFLVFVFAAIAIGLAAVIAAGLRSGIHRSPARLLCLLLIGGLFGWMTWGLRANPEEAMHFVEYGVLGVLLFRALRHRIQNGTLYVTAAMLGAVIGCADEIYQWIIPKRFFDFKDLLLNAVAGVLVQLALAGVLRPASVRGPLTRFSVRMAGGTSLLFLLVLAACLGNTPGVMQWYGRWLPAVNNVDEAMVEYGYRVEDPGTGTFFTRIHPEKLHDLDQSRGEAAAKIVDAYRPDSKYAEFLSLYPSYRDAYLHEARVHLFRRDRYRQHARAHRRDPKLSREYATIAYREDQIMRTRFPVLYRHSSYAWDEAVRDGVRSMADLDIAYVSKVSRRVFTWRRAGGLFALLGVLCAAVVWLMVCGLRRAAAGEGAHD